MCEKGGMGGFGGQTGNRIPSNKAQLAHIVELINDQTNKFGIDGNVKTW